MSNGHLVVVLQKSPEMNQLLENQLERVDPEILKYVFFTIEPLLAQQVCEEGAYAMLSCNYPDTEYDATELAVKCRMENSTLIFITYSAVEVMEPTHPMALIDGHIDKIALNVKVDALSVVEVIAGLAHGLSVGVLAAKYPDVLTIPRVPVCVPC